MLKSILVLFLLQLIFYPSEGQDKLKTENVFLITLDGFRWQELFTGADSLLIHAKEYTHDPAGILNKYWHKEPEIRRKKLMPFFWSIIAEEGQLIGNRLYGNNINLTNNHWFSYPGYNEILTGYGDPSVNSNRKINNSNITVLEYINNQPAFKGKVAVFGSWDVFPYIINEERSGISVNAGFEPAVGEDLSGREIFLNELQEQIPSPWGGVRLDAFTHHYAMEHIKKYSPKLLYIAYGETDDFAHDGRYDFYLNSAHQADAFIKDLWEFVQSHDQYRDKTTLIIATDHGRGTMPIETWKDHGTQIKGADEVWLALIGPDIPAKGEVKIKKQYYQNQVAGTIAYLLGVNYKPEKMIGEPLKLGVEGAEMR